LPEVPFFLFNFNLSFGSASLGAPS
jgi:hypothetical protein